MIHDNSSCNFIGSGTLIWISCACLNFHGGALKLIWHGDLCVPCGVSLEFQKEVFYVGSP